MEHIGEIKSLRIAEESLEEKRASVEAAIKRKRECERRALSIVEHLVENLSVDSLWLTEHAKFINPSYYQDITEERAIGKQCGFPVCPHRLEKIWKQQFSIDLRSKKVFDVSYRKNFCSDVCYFASNNFKDQLLTSPLWMRKKDQIPKFYISLAPNKGLRGDEVAVTAIALPDESSTEVEVVIVEKEIKPRPVFKDKHLHPVTSPRDVVFKAIERWLTIKTLNWLQDTDDKSDKDVASIRENLDCLKVETIVDGAADLSHSKELKPLTNGNELNLYDKFPPSIAESKVRAFFYGKIEYTEGKSNEGMLLKDAKESKDENLDETVPIIMPLANLSAQKVLRKKIVMDYVEKWFPQLTAISGLQFRECQRYLSELVSTFNLTADTVTFRPNEVPLLNLLLALLLSFRVSPIKEKLVQEPIRIKLSEFLAPYERTLDELKEFLLLLLKSLEDK